MTEKQDQDRTETARRHDDGAMIEGLEATPSASGTAGGDVARDVGSRDDLDCELEPDAGVTRVEGRDKVQPQTRGRTDHQGAQSGG